MRMQCAPWLEALVHTPSSCLLPRPASCPLLATLLPQALVPGYRAATQSYWEAVGQLGGCLLRLLALSLGLPPEFFAPYFTRPMLFLRPLHYRPEEKGAARGLCERLSVHAGMWHPGQALPAT